MLRRSVQLRLQNDLGAALPVRSEPHRGLHADKNSPGCLVPARRSGDLSRPPCLVSRAGLLG